MPERNSALGRALHYLLEQRPYRIRYLEDGRLELSSNRAERSMKPFVMGRSPGLGTMANGPFLSGFPGCFRKTNDFAGMNFP